MTSRSTSDNWERGDPYDEFMGRWSRRLAPPFLTWLGARPDAWWLDVGCGTGALCAAILEHAAPARVFGVEPAEGFRSQASRTLGTRAELASGSAASLPHGDASMDVTLSGLVLNFVPDVAAALTEMVRVTRPGGLVAAYVWDYADKMEILRWFWDVAADLDPVASPLHEGERFPLCRPERLTAAFQQAGLADVTVESIEVAAPFAAFDAYWRPFLGGQGPAPTYVASLSESRRDALQMALRTRMPVEPDGSLTLRARAWGVRGMVPSA